MMINYYSFVCVSLCINVLIIQGKLTLSPSELQSVICEVGASDSVTCNTTEGTLRWYVTIPRMFTESRFMSRNSETPIATSLMINTSTITFTRLSAQGMLPLVTMVRIDHVSEALNGTVINCTEAGLNLINPDTSATTVQLVDQQQYMNGYLHPLNVVVVNASEQFGPEAVTLVLKWTSNSTHSSHISHFVSGIDQHEIRVLDNHSNSVQLSIPYNAVFNITITRILTPCNQTLSSASILLSYFSCRYPSLMQGVQCSVDDYSERLLNGTILTFTCPSGQILNGHNATMCMENGEWEPDPSMVKCSDVDCDTSVCQNGNNATKTFSDTDTELENTAGTIIVQTVTPILTIIIIVLICAFIAVTVLWRKVLRKAKLKEDNEVEHNTYQEFEFDNAQHNQADDTSTALTYAEIGAASFKEMPLTSGAINSEENRMTYAQINHSQNNAAVDVEQVQLQANDTSTALTYAEIGAASFKKMPLTPGAINFEENRVAYAQINHSKKNAAVDAKQVRSQVDVNPDDNINLDTLLFQLRGKNLEWYKLGEAMGIQKEMLDKFSKQCSPEECLIETLEYWLQNHIGQPTWREIAKYLKMVELNDLAEEIENVYTTGQLPVKCDEDDCFSVPPIKTDALPPPLPPKSTLNFQNRCGQETSRTSRAPPPLPRSVTSTPIQHGADTGCIHVSQDEESAIKPPIPPRPPK